MEGFGNKLEVLKCCNIIQLLFYFTFNYIYCVEVNVNDIFKRGSQATFLQSGKSNYLSLPVSTKCRLQTGYKMQTADCRLSTKCRLTRKTFFFYVRNVSTFDFITYLLVVSIIVSRGDVLLLTMFLLESEVLRVKFMWKMFSCHFRKYCRGMSQHELPNQSILPKANKLKNFSVLKNVLRSTQ